MSKPPDEPGEGLIKQPTTTGSTSPTISSATGIDSTVLQKFLQVAEKDAQARLEEISVEKQVRSDAHEYAKLALNAQTKDLQDERAHRKSERRDRMVFAGGVMLLLVVFMGALIYFGQAELARQIATHVGALIAGAYGAYNYGIRRGKENKADE